MKLMVNHQTHYRYTQVARNSVQSIKMMPQSSMHQSIENWQLVCLGNIHVKETHLIIYGSLQLRGMNIAT